MKETDFFLLPLNAAVFIIADVCVSVLTAAEVNAAT